MKLNKIYISNYHTPVGEMILGSYDDSICLCDWDVENRRDTIARRLCRCLEANYVYGLSAVVEAAMARIDEYFLGNRADFTIPLRFAGTAFQCRVWLELLKIPYGVTVSYADIARNIGCPKGVRAVASAIGSNAISILVPCHRVVGSNKSLTGYAGGLEAKRSLLALESNNINKLC